MKPIEEIAPDAELGGAPVSGCMCAARLGMLELEQAFDGAPMGRAVLDSDCRYRRVNRRLAEMYGLAPAALAGRRVDEFSPACSATVLRARDALEQVEPQSFEIEVQTAAHPGQRRIWTISWSPLKSTDGSAVTGINMVAEDVTDRMTAVEDIQSVAELLEQRVIERTAELALETQERQETERLLHQLQRVELIGQLTSGIAHDFNNMLGVIRANVDLLARRLTDEQYRRFTEGAIAGVERAAALSRQLLSFARRQTFDPKPLDLRTRILHMTELFGRTLGERIVIDTIIPDDLWPALTDETQLENALLNLVVNACDAMAGAGRVTIKAANVSIGEADIGRGGAAPGDYLMISVSDTGTGMLPEVMALAFEPFFTTKEGRGTGLGLAQVYSFAQQSRGHVRIASAPGQGTCVTLYLPREASLAPGAAAAPDDQPVPRGSRRETVLVVEDDQSVRSSTVDVLRDLGYSVMAAADGAAALEVLEGGAKIDLLFTDVGLPGEHSGPSLADAATARRPGLKILFASAYAEEAVQVGRLAGGSTLLKKPFTYAGLARRVREALAGGGRQRRPAGVSS